MTVTLTGTFEDSAGTPESGRVIFALATTDSNGVVIVTDNPVGVILDANGAFSLDLQATDELVTSGNLYHVTERLNGRRPRSYYIELPAATDPANLADLATYDEPPFVVYTGTLAASNAGLNAHVADDDAHRRAVQTPRIPAAPVMLESPYDIAGTGVHPDVVDAGEDGWGQDSNGKAWRYWMVYNPYWRAQATYENVVLQVSDDGILWVTPPGLTNPVDAYPGSNATNSDCDMVLVSGTMYLFYREQNTVTNVEYLRLRTSSDGITWSAQTDVMDTSGDSPTDRDNFISPTFLYHSGTWTMYYTNGGALKRRTSSSPGSGWSAATACTMTGGITAASHLDAIRTDSGDVHLILQGTQAATLTEGEDGLRHIWLGKSTDGITFTVGDTPLIRAEHIGQRMMYRTCGLHETRNGKDYYRLWASCVSYSLAITGDNVDDETDGLGKAESYYIGYTEGYDPDDPYTGDKPDLELDGSLVAAGQVRAEQIGARRVFGRFLAGARGVVDKFRSQDARIAQLFVSGPADQQDDASLSSEVPSSFAYTGYLPPLLVTNNDTDDHPYLIGLHYRGADNTKTAPEGWAIGVNANGHLLFYQRNSAGNFTLRTYLDYSGGVLNTPGGITVSGGNFIIQTLPQISGDRVRIATAKTITSSADSYGATGDICWDSGYLYVKTGSGAWKRAALSTF